MEMQVNFFSSILKGKKNSPEISSLLSESSFFLSESSAESSTVNCRKQFSDKVEDDKEFNGLNSLAFPYELRISSDFEKIFELLSSFFVYENPLNLSSNLLRRELASKHSWLREFVEL